MTIARASLPKPARQIPNSNPRENRLVRTAAYQRRAANGIADGVRRFVAP